MELLNVLPYLIPEERACVDRSSKVWASGTGYGRGQTSGEVWDARQAALTQDAQDAELRRVMASLADALGCRIPRASAPAAANGLPSAADDTTLGATSSGVESSQLRSTSVECSYPCCATSCTLSHWMSVPPLATEPWAVLSPLLISNCVVNALSAASSASIFGVHAMSSACYHCRNEL